jgi:hypothetical protein
VAIVVRYFSTTGAGAEDGTTWADRAPFIDSGAYNTIITAFDFGASDSLEVRLGPGTYTAPASFSSTIFTDDNPRPQNPLVIHGCDSSGNLIAADVEWNCAEGPLDVAGYPVIDMQTDQLTLAHLHMRCVSITGARSGAVCVFLAGMQFDFCKIENTNSATGAFALFGSVGSGSFTNCELVCSGTSFNSVASASNFFYNIRVAGNASATSGNRHGIQFSSNVFFTLGTKICVIDCPGTGVLNSGTSASSGLFLSGAVVNNCGTGINCTTGSGATEANQGKLRIDHCFVANCTTGISASNAASVLTSNRLRNSTNLSVPTNSLDADNYTASGSDTDEFVNAASGDYRMKSTSTYWGKGIGAGDEPATGGGTSRPVNPFTQTVIA